MPTNNKMSSEGDPAPNLDDSKLLKAVNMTFTSPTARSLLAAGSKASAAPSNASGSLASSANSAAALKAAAEAYKHIDVILEGEDAHLAELVLSKYLFKVEQLEESRLSEPEVGFRKFKPPAETWRLINLAAQHSSELYGDPSVNDDATIMIKPRNVVRHIKQGRIQAVDSAGTIVVCFRGTVGLHDWLANFNDEPTDEVLTSGESRRCHSGFLESFKASEDEIAQDITKMVAGHAQIRRLLFTGHSAGGAIAQLCYDGCSSASSSIGKAVSGFEQVDCITFGAPPITSTPIAPLSPSVFLAIMNEGDPVVLAQPAFVKALLDVYVLTREKRESKYPDGYIPPAAAVHPSGVCVILRDVNQESADVVLEALEVPAATVEKTLFGDFSAHSMSVYKERVEELAEVAVDAGEKL